MVGVIRPECDGREPRRWRALPPPLLLPMILALLRVASAQWTAQLRRSCLADSAATLCCIGCSCDEGSRARVQLASAVSALRESEARSAQLNLDLTTAAERYRTAIVAARSSEVAAGAAQNVCDAHALELRASADAANRLAASASRDFRRAADERAALRIRADGADERLREHDAGLRAFELTLSETRSELNATSSNVATNEQQRVADMNALRQSMLFRLTSIEDHINSTGSTGSTGSKQNQSVECLPLIQDALNASYTSLHMALQREIQATTVSESKLMLVQSETTRNLSSLSHFVGSALFSINKRINVSSDQMGELFKIANQQESAISSLNQTQRYSEAGWNYQASVLNAQLNSTERQRVLDMDALRLSTFSRLALVEDRLDSTGNKLNESVERLSLRQDSLNYSLTSLGAAVRHDIISVTVLTESTLLANERQRVADTEDLRARSLSRFALIEDRLNSTRKQLNDSVERLSLRHNSLNNSLMSLGATVRRDVERVAVMAESKMLGVKTEMASNLSSLAVTVASLNFSKQINTSQISELFTIADQLKFVLSHLNRTQQESDDSCKRQASALSAELNLTRFILERLREEFGRLRDDHERLIADARNISAVLRACPSGWQRNGSWCYLLVTSWSGSWNDSRGRCNMMAADLVTVPSAAVNAFLSANMVQNSRTSNFWLGATDVEQEGVWRWITGEIFYSAFQPRSYANFAVGEPANNYIVRNISENCLTMNRMGSWNDVPCHFPFPFFCRMYRP